MNRYDLGRIVITGAGGFIGGRFFHRLAAQGANVRGWHRPLVDLVDPTAVAAAMARDRPQSIFHLAAAGVSRGQENQVDIIRHDIAMIENLLAYAPEGARILVAGSLSEYGRSGRFAEDDLCTPTNAYGIAKLASGLMARAYGARRGHTVKVARLFGVYGPGEAPSRFFPSLLAALRARTPIALSDGMQQRDFIHVDDACTAMAAVLSAEDVPDVVNIGTGMAVSIYDAATWLADATNAPRDLLRFGEQPRSPHDCELMLADVTRLCRVTAKAPPQRLMPGLSSDLFDPAQNFDFMKQDSSGATFEPRKSAAVEQPLQSQSR